MMVSKPVAQHSATFGHRLRGWLNKSPNKGDMGVLDFRTRNSASGLSARALDFTKTPSLQDWSNERLAVVQDVFGLGRHIPANIRELDTSIARLGIGSNSLVAELGAGLGALSRRVNRLSCRAIAYEPDDLLSVEWNRSMRRQPNHERWTLHKSSLDDIDFGQYRFDYMLSREGLLGVGNKPRLLEKMRKAMKLGGTFLISDFVRSDGGSSEAFTRWRRLEPQRISLMTMRQWETALKDCHFETIECTNITAQVRRNILHAFDRYTRSIKDMARNTETGRLDWVLAEAEHWALRLGAFDDGSVQVMQFFCRAGERFS